MTKRSRFALHDDDGGAAPGTDGTDGGGDVALDLLLQLPDRLREQQQVFERTGGVHAAGLFSFEGELLCLREDVGRHNAVDKVVGWALREGRLPLQDTCCRSPVGPPSSWSRRPIWRASPPCLLSARRPSLAVELADKVGLTLAGFSRGRSINVYTHPALIGTAVGHLV